MSPRIVALSVLLSLGGAASAEDTPPAVDLFAGETFAGWSVVTAEPVDIRHICTRTPEGIAIAGNPLGYLATDATYENYRLRFEYRWPAATTSRSNGGILLHVASAPVAPSPWPTCIQLQTKVRYAGDLLQMSGSKFAEPITTPGKGNTPPIRAHQQSSSELPLGEWNTVDILCNRGTIEVRINGVLQNRVTQVEPHAGRIGLQLEGAPFEVRNLRLTPLVSG
ncbi:MAG TPA: DUF1080 domain-containing protein [Opitutaceae bacterium]|nr:DUF1080 domain-containing protein [Opitutaceae bacterium]